MATTPLNSSTEESSWKLGLACSVCLKPQHFACWPVCQGVLALVVRAVAPDSGTSCALRRLVSENAALVQENATLKKEKSALSQQGAALSKKLKTFEVYKHYRTAAGELVLLEKIP